MNEKKRDIRSLMDPKRRETDASIRANAIQQAMDAEWLQWGRNAPVEDRIILSAWLPSIEHGSRTDIAEVSRCLIEQIDGSASRASLRHLASMALWSCLQQGFPPPAELTELSAKLLSAKRPRHKRVRAEERLKAIEFIVANPQAGTGVRGLGRRAIARAAGVGEGTIQKWLSDPHFRLEVNERAGKTILPDT